VACPGVNFTLPLSGIKLKFKEIKLSLCMPWRQKWGSVGTASLFLTFALDGTESSHSHFASFVSGKNPWDTFSTNLLAAQSQF